MIPLGQVGSSNFYDFNKRFNSFLMNVFMFILNNFFYQDYVLFLSILELNDFR